MEVFMSPGSVTEKLFFSSRNMIAICSCAGRRLQADGEDIGVLEVPLAEALAMIERGQIIDGKTIILLQYAQLHRLLD